MCESTFYVAKTKTLISSAVTVQQLICAFVFCIYSKSRFSHNVSHLNIYFNKNLCYYDIIAGGPHGRVGKVAVFQRS